MSWIDNDVLNKTMKILYIFIYMIIHTHIHKYVSRHIYAYVHVHSLIAKRNNFRVAIGTTWTVCLKNDYVFNLSQKKILIALGENAH